MTVRDKNMRNCVYRFCYKVTESVLLTEAKVNTKAVFRKLRASRACQLDNRVEFGYESIQYSWANGCPEYKSVARRMHLPTQTEAGWDGVRHEVLHEVAHIIQYIADGENDNHGTRFSKVFWWLLNEYPLTRCFGIAGVWAGDAPPGWGTADNPKSPSKPSAVAVDAEISFRVTLREKRQVWSWRLQSDGTTVNVAIGKKYWSHMTVEEQLFLNGYIQSAALHKLQGASGPSYLERCKHDALVEKVIALSR